MIGPAIAGVVIAGFGTGWAFLINGASFVAVLVSLTLLRSADLRPNARANRVKGDFLGSVTGGFRYVWSRPDLKADPHHAGPDRHLRTELPDLHLDHGDQGVS